MLKLVVILSAIILSSCGTTKGSATKVILPPEPDYPRIYETELACLDEIPYTNLVVRDQTCMADNKKLRALIQKHNEGVQE